MNTNVWQGKNVLVTGADGFMGSHLSERLVNYGAKVTALIKNKKLIHGKNIPNLSNLDNIRSEIDMIFGDIGNIDTLDLIERSKPNVIFHLAAEAYVNKSFEQPREVIRTNVDGTLNVLHACMDKNKKPLEYIEQIVCTSSSEVYGTYNEPISENFEMKPSSPYGASKAAADRLAYSYFFTFNLPIAIIRPFNTFGPRHTYDAPPKFISLAYEDKDITIYGDGKQSRDLTYVDDMIDAFLIMGSDKKAIGQAVNFGTGRDIQIKELAQKIKTILGSNSKIIHLDPRLGEVKRLCCNPNKAKQLFNWEPKVNLEEGLKRNIEWFKEIKYANQHC